MAQAHLHEHASQRPTIDSGHDRVQIKGPPRQRTKARIRRPTGCVTELRRDAAELANRSLEVGEAAKLLCDLVGDDRPLLSEVYLAQLRYMRNRPTDDFHATATLGIIERALAQLPRPVPPSAPPRWAPPAPRNFPLLGFGRHRAAGARGAT